jgi:hypothetical protein
VDRHRSVFPRERFALSAAWAFSSHDDDAIEPLTPLSPLSPGPVERTFVRIFKAGEIAKTDSTAPP